MSYRGEYFRAMFAQSPSLIWLVAAATFLVMGVFFSYVFLRPKANDLHAMQLPLFDEAEINPLDSRGNNL